MRSVRNKPAHAIVPLFGALLLLGTSLAGDAPAEATEAAFDFTFEDVNPGSPTHGQRLTLSKLYADKGVVLSFMASWCGPCWTEAPHLQGLHATGEAPVVGMAADEYGAPLEIFLDRAAHFELTMPILFVPAEATDELEQHYDHQILPATYLIDSDGGIRRVLQGAVPAERLRAEIRKGLGY